MKLPNAQLAVVERRKVTEYLLSSEHRFGAAKARFFAAFGFDAASWNVLADALKEHGREGEVVQETDTGYGSRYEVDGELVTPDGRRPSLRTVWQVDTGQVAPRLITAYPVDAP